MRFARFTRNLAPVAAFALAALVAGCGTDVRINGEEGKKLSELDMSGSAPTGIVLAGPDRVRLSEGDRLAITIDGDPAKAENLRFTLKGGTLGVLRRDGWRDATALTVNVTMPAPREVTVAGSGTIDAPALAPDAEVNIAGSGDLKAGTISGDKFELNVAGSGTITGGGAVKSLDLSIAGSGEANLAALRVDKADISITGSGNAVFTSDGEVSASIIGSGHVTVKGRAKCKVSAMGSGKLVCESGEPEKEEKQEN